MMKLNLKIMNVLTGCPLLSQRSRNQAAEDSHKIALPAKCCNDGITFSFFANGTKILTEMK